MDRNHSYIFYLDLLRAIATIAVITIHVLGPLRFPFGEIQEPEWLAVISINSLIRWAIPLFIMISGALLLSDKREFNCNHYLTRRISKVVVPFLGWSLIYAVIGGFSNGIWQYSETVNILMAAPNEPVWYHLWFFYDFIPLYFVIPLLIPLLRIISTERLRLILFAWALLTLMHWLNVDSFLQENLVLYTGYLILGWYLFNHNNSTDLKYWLSAGIAMLGINLFGSGLLILQNGEYSSFFMGYKTLNTAIIGGMLFVLAQKYAGRIQGKLRLIISLIAKYSLGIYLIHPIFLIPIRNLENGVYNWFGTNWLSIPLISITVLSASLILTILLAKTPVIKRLVP